jgi:hypothetical protein
MYWLSSNSPENHTIKYAIRNSEESIDKHIMSGIRFISLHKMEGDKTNS